jgi:hypothetical protein
MFNTYINIPNKQFWFNIKLMDKNLRSDSKFKIENYWLGRFQNEFILDVNEHGKRPLTALPELLAYAQLNEIQTQHFKSEYQMTSINDDISWF